MWIQLQILHTIYGGLKKSQNIQIEYKRYSIKTLIIFNNYVKGLVTLKAGQKRGSNVGGTRHRSALKKQMNTRCKYERDS